MKRFFTSVLLFFTFVILILVVICLVVFFRYKSWAKEFESDMDSTQLITSESIEEIDLEERITEFALSQEDTESLRLSKSEIGSVLFTTIEAYLKEDIYLDSMYISSEKNRWEIYLKVGYEDILIWSSFDINKDDIQSAQIYTSAIYIGPYEISKYIDVVEMVNKGIAEAIITLNENGFVGRYIENIELLDNAIVLKGSRY